MNLKYPVYLIIITSGLFSSAIDLSAQINLEMHIDAGENYASEGLFVTTAGFGAYRFGETEIAGGCQFDLKSASGNIFSGFIIKPAREFTIKEFPFKIQGLYVYNRFSESLYEYNWGILANIERNHFIIHIGTNFRTYAITKTAMEKYGIESHKKIHENWNLMYLVNYNLKPSGHKWNIGLTLTNIDYFIIEQETNPVFNLNAKYKVSPPVTLFVESWHKSSGAFNLRVNHFGFFIRTGVVWEIKR